MAGDFECVKAELQRLRSGWLPVVLFVTHDLGGGVETHVRELVAALRGRAVVLFLRPGPLGGMVSLMGLQRRLSFIGFEGLLEALSWVGFDRVHVHHVAGFPAGVANALLRLGAPLDLTLHDHSIINGNPTLTDRSGVFDERALLERMPDGDVWLEQELRLLASKADRIFLPSARQKRLIAAFLPDLELQVRPPPEAEGGRTLPVEARPSHAAGGFRVLCLGSFTLEKGASVLAAVARLAKSRRMAIDFILLGESLYPMPGCVRQLGRYDEAELQGLISEMSPDILWLPAQCPETWSYTLSAGVDCGLPILASDLGALAERLEGRPLSWLFSHRASAESWLDELMRVRSLIEGGGRCSWLMPGAPVFYGRGGAYLSSVRGGQHEGGALVWLPAALRDGEREPVAWRRWWLRRLVRLRGHPIVGSLGSKLPKKWLRMVRRFLMR